MSISVIIRLLCLFALIGGIRLDRGALRGQYWSVQFLILVVGVGTLVAAGNAVRVAVRWWHVRRRPLLTCADFASVARGTLVVVHGRTADGPMINAPRSTLACVGHQTIKFHTHVVSDNYNEHSRDVGFEAGDTDLYGPDGTRVPLGERIRTSKLFVTAPPMMIIAANSDDPRNDSTDQRTEEEYIVPADLAVVATGVVTLDEHGNRSLEWAGKRDGSAAGRADRIAHKFVHDLVFLVILTAVLATVTTSLILKQIG
jgi:hypothetical protein